MAAGAALVWLGVASSMRPPRRLRSLTLPAGTGRAPGYDELVGVVSGVEDVIHVPGQRTTYIQVDEDALDSGHLERVLGRRLTP